MRLFFLLTLLIQLNLFGADPIGRITAVEGLVTAISGGAERTLSRGAEIFVKETIRVAVNATAQIQFTDGGLVTLISGSEFRVNSYKFNKVFQRDESSSELIKGGLRALSGTIAKKHPSRYEVKTPSATIGLRGTTLEAVITGSSVYVGVSDGRALVKNAVSSVMIGEGEKANFVHVPGLNQPMQLMVRRPTELERSLFTPPAGATSIEEAPSEGDLMQPGGASIQGGC